MAEPLGAELEIAETILARYSVGAVDLVDLDGLLSEVEVRSHPRRDRTRLRA